MDPTTGTFISVDPLLVKTGEPYLYAGGNPVTYSDPAGLEKGANGEAQANCRLAGNCQASQWDLFDDSGWLAKYHGIRGRVGQGCTATRNYIKTLLAGAVILGAVACVLVCGPVVAAGGGAKVTAYALAPAATSAAKAGLGLVDDNPGGGSATNTGKYACPC